MHIAVRVRIFIARHRWVYWTAVAAVAAGIGATVFDAMRAIDHTRTQWGDTSTVIVATADLEPDGAVTVRTAELPVAMVPASALHALPDGARLHQRVMRGEVLTTADIVAGPGPAAHAPADSAVVAIADPLSRNVSVGLQVSVGSEGILLAETAVVTDVVDDVVFVAVPSDDAPDVAAAAQAGLATMIYRP